MRSERKLRKRGLFFLVSIWALLIIFGCGGGGGGDGNNSSSSSSDGDGIISPPPPSLTASVFTSNQNGLYRLEDGGRNCTLLLDRAAIASVLTDGLTIYAGFWSDERMVKSVDGGSTWQSIQSSPPWIYGIYDVGNDLYVTAAWGLYKSADCGASWICLNNRLPLSNTISVFDLVNDNDTLYCSMPGDGIGKSTDNGKSWQACGNNGFPINNLGQYMWVDKIAVFNNELFASTGRNGLYRSTDGGDSWNRIMGNYSIMGAPNIAGTAIAATSIDLLSWFTSFLGIDDTLYIARPNCDGNPGVYKSKDKGITWKLTGLARAIYSIVFSENTFFATGDDSIYASPDGSEWYDIYHDSNARSSFLHPISSVPDTRVVDIVDQVIENAENNLGKTSGDVYWEGNKQTGVWADSEWTYCAGFVRMCFGEEAVGRVDSKAVYDHFNALGLVKVDATAPKGSVVFYDRDDSNRWAGHEGIADGEGNCYSVVNKTNGVLLKDVEAFDATYLGYVTAGNFKSYYSW